MRSAPLDPGARDLERVATRDRVVVVELAGDQPAGQGQVVERDAAGRAGRRVERDAQRAAAVLDVVDVEPEVGGDRRDERADAGQHGAAVSSTVDLLS